MNALKNEITEFIKQALNLPDNAVIIRGSVQITDQDEVEIIGATSVDYQHFNISQLEVVDPQERPLINMSSGKLGVKSKRGPHKKVSQATAKERAVEGKGKDISEEKIKGWRITLRLREGAGQLSDSQRAALDATKGMHAGKLSPEQKQQIKDIHDETTPKQF